MHIFISVTYICEFKKLTVIAIRFITLRMTKYGINVHYV